MPGESKRSEQTKPDGASTPRPIGLSKSRYTIGLQCHKRLWWTVHEPDAPELVPDGALQAVFDQGHLVGELAREQFPGGALIDIEHWKADERVQATTEALAAGAKVVYEASFRADDVFVSVDVLHRARGKRGFTLTEVKSTLSAKESHIEDAAVQTHVVRKAGLPVSRVEVMHLNRECRHPDLSNLFVRTNVTSEVKKSLDGIPREIRRQIRVLRSDEPPDVTPGPHCFDPWECPFLERCHEPAPEYSIGTLCASAKKRAALAAEGYGTIHDLPEDLPLQGVADRQRRAVRSGEIVVEHGLAEALGALQPPIAHLDFETVSPAIPVWRGCAPYTQVPVQFSVRIEAHARRRAKEIAWLAETGDDPRPALAAALVDALEGTGSVVVYSASFEGARLRELADAVPALSDDLRAIADRLVDLLPLVRAHVYHPAFGGSFSLKTVAPALVPSFSYEDLEIANGGAASSALAALLVNGDPFSFTTYTETTSINSKNWARVFDPTAHTWTTKSPFARQTVVKVDAAGRPTQFDVPGLSPALDSLFVHYDSFGRVDTVSQGTSLTDPNLRATSFGYTDPNSLDKVSTVTNALQQFETYDHDQAGRVRVRHRADLTTVGFAYDSNGNLTKVTTPTKFDHLFTYTLDNEIETYTAPALGVGNATTTYHYDADRMLSTIARPDGTSVVVTSDPVSGLPVAIDSPGNRLVFGYKHDPMTGRARGQLDAVLGPFDPNDVVTPRTVVSYAYSGLLLANTAWSGAITGAVDRTFDSFFRVATETVNATSTVAFGYDDDGLPNCVQPGATSCSTSAPNAMSVTYDLAPRLVSTGIGAVSDSRGYDAFGQIHQYTATVSGSPVYAVTYDRDVLGRISTKTETLSGATKATQYGYDAVGRLHTVTEGGVLVRQYDPDDNGNRKTFHDYEHSSTISGTINAQDQLTDYGSTHYDYTPNGELWKKTENGQETKYTYDALGNLTRVEFRTGLTVTKTIDYLVDGIGRRVGKKVDGVFRQGWLYGDGLRPVAELDQNGALSTRFVYATGRNVPDFFIKGGVIYRIVTDHLGSPRLIVDSGGNVAETLDWDEFGNGTGSTMIPFGFAGGIYDSDTKLVRFGARDYDPVTGRWTTKDPILFAGGDTNLYAYVGNDPVNWKDPRGFFDPAGAIVGGVVGGVGAGIATALSPGATWQMVAAATGAGLFGGAIGGAIDPSIGIGAGLGAAFGAYGNAISGCGSTGNIIGGAIGGAFGGAIGGIPGAGLPGVAIGTFVGTLAVWDFGMAGDALGKALIGP